MDISDFRVATGKRLKKYILSNGFTQKEFAVSIGQGPTTVGRVLKGLNGISSEMALAILQKYPQLNWDWLFSGRGMMEYPLSTTNLEITVDNLPQPQHLLQIIALLQEQITDLKSFTTTQAELIVLLREQKK